MQKRTMAPKVTPNPVDSKAAVPWSKVGIGAGRARAERSTAIVLTA